MNSMSHNQLSLFGDRVSDDTLEEVARFLRAVKNIGKTVSIKVVSDAQRDYRAQATTAN